MTPKERMKKTTISLARSLKPSGRLNRDDIKRAGKARKEMSLSEIKDVKKLGKAAKMASKGFMQKGFLGPLRPIRERAKESRLVGGKSKLRKPKR